MRGIALAEVGHIINIIPPVDIPAGKTGDVFSMREHSHVTIIVQIGVSAAAFTKILVNECTSFAAAGATAIAFNVYKEETAAGDTLGARTAVTAAGLTPSGNNNIMYVIEINAAELSDGSEFVQLSLTSTTQSIIASAIAILTGARYGGEQSATQIV